MEPSIDFEGLGPEASAAFTHYLNLYNTGLKDYSAGLESGARNMDTAINELVSLARQHRRPEVEILAMGYALDFDRDCHVKYAGSRVTWLASKKRRSDRQAALETGLDDGQEGQHINIKQEGGVNGQTHNSEGIDRRDTTRSSSQESTQSGQRVSAKCYLPNRSSNPSMHVDNNILQFSPYSLQTPVNGKSKPCTNTSHIATTGSVDNKIQDNPQDINQLSKSAPTANVGFGTLMIYPHRFQLSADSTEGDKMTASKQIGLSGVQSQINSNHKPKEEVAQSAGTLSGAIITKGRKRCNEIVRRKRPKCRKDKETEYSRGFKRPKSGQAMKRKPMAKTKVYSDSDSEPSDGEVMQGRKRVSKTMRIRWARYEESKAYTGARGIEDSEGRRVKPVPKADVCRDPVGGEFSIRRFDNTQAADASGKDVERAELLREKREAEKHIEELTEIWRQRRRDYLLRKQQKEHDRKAEEQLRREM